TEARAAEAPAPAAPARDSQPESSNGIDFELPAPDEAPSAASAAPAAQSAPESPASAALPAAMDEALREIYTRETGAHVATIRSYLQREALGGEPHLLPEDVYRACHTLAGSSKMAQARHGVRLAEPLDHWL